MQTEGFHSGFYRALRFAEGAAAVLAVLIVANNFREIPTGTGQWWTDALAAIQSSSFWWLVGVYITGSVARALRSLMRRPNLKALLHQLLDAFHDHVFTELITDSTPAFEHRVTLFKHIRWNWRKPLGGFGWLRPIRRSGHVAQNPKKCWRACNDPSQFEGVAGQAWGRNRIYIVGGLPDPGAGSIATREETATQYADKTSVARSWVEERKLQSKSFPRWYCGVPVRVNGKPWGILMLDSRNAEARDEEEVRATYRLFGSILGNVLERG
jgi:hypothetical protein